MSSNKFIHVLKLIKYLKSIEYFKLNILDYYRHYEEHFTYKQNQNIVLEKKRVYTMKTLNISYGKTLV
jgi:hypothetical protein